MEQKDFKISNINSSIVLEKDNQSFEIFQGSDEDLFFSTSQDEICFELNSYSRNYHEWQTYIVFEYLMKSIIGKYILNGDNKKEYSQNPKDFVDLENKIIIWHSDSDIDNVLKLQYVDNVIKITIFKSKEAKNYHTNLVRIRTDGSDYERYYQEFLEFYKHLVLLERNLNKSDVEAIESKEEPKKLSLLKRFNKKK